MYTFKQGRLELETMYVTDVMIIWNIESNIV